jgi:hypothetical protein
MYNYICIDSLIFVLHTLIHMFGGKQLKHSLSHLKVNAADLGKSPRKRFFPPLHCLQDSSGSLRHKLVILRTVCLKEKFGTERSETKMRPLYQVWCHWKLDPPSNLGAQSSCTAPLSCYLSLWNWTLVVASRTLGSFSNDYEYKDLSRETHAVCLRHPILTRKGRSRRSSEYKIVEKFRSPHYDFSKTQRKLAVFVFQK